MNCELKKIEYRLFYIKVFDVNQMKYSYHINTLRISITDKEYFG